MRQGARFISTAQLCFVWPTEGNSVAMHPASLTPMEQVHVKFDNRISKLLSVCHLFIHICWFLLPLIIFIWYDPEAALNPGLSSLFFWFLILSAVESIALIVSLFTWKFGLYLICLRVYAASKMAFLCFAAYKMFTSDERIVDLIKCRLKQQGLDDLTYGIVYISVLLLYFFMEFVCLPLWSMGCDVIEKRNTLKYVQNMEGRISEISTLNTLLKT
ncbi:hypothetical protein WR25_02465 [Diploscapter pachys]|uniref:Uncharacterized protein n=1 Tax=Diploscapter pachys TaxID=2018661 RepID=A0A2A2KKV7_9BILA|nr:hypothetical protein WR25_02465 [Diploscapter pachys]